MHVPGTVPGGRLRIMNRSLIISLAAVVLASASCGRTDSVPGGEITLEASVMESQTRAAVTGGLVPDGYTIHLSSSIASSTGGTEAGDYFTDVVYRKDGAVWRADATVLWPMGCRLDFLGVAVDAAAAGFDVTSNIRWNSGCCTDGFTLSVPDSSVLDSEVLFSSMGDGSVGSGSVPLVFRHSQSWLQFRVRSTETALLNLAGITVTDVYLGGTLTVCTPDPIDPSCLTSSWDFRGRRQYDYSIPEVTGQEIGTDPLVFDVLVPWQPRRDLDVTIAMKDSPADPAPVRTITYTCRLPAGWWYDGEKYIYELDASSTGVRIGTPVVQPWGSVEPEITL